MASELLDRVYGSLIGGAIGDALGAPVEGWYYQAIRGDDPGANFCSMAERLVAALRAERQAALDRAELLGEMPA